MPLRANLSSTCYRGVECGLCLRDALHCRLCSRHYSSALLLGTRAFAKTDHRARPNATSALWHRRRAERRPHRGRHPHTRRFRDATHALGHVSRHPRHRSGATVDRGRVPANFRGCGGCFEVYTQHTVFDSAGNRRIDVPTDVVNVYAVLRGTKRPNDYVVMSGDIDSRVSDPMDRTSDSPGANDNASGMAGVLEAARVLSTYSFDGSILLAGLVARSKDCSGGGPWPRWRRRRGGTSSASSTTI